MAEPPSDESIRSLVHSAVEWLGDKAASRQYNIDAIDLSEGQLTEHLLPRIIVTDGDPADLFEIVNEFASTLRGIIAVEEVVVSRRPFSQGNVKVWPKLTYRGKAWGPMSHEIVATSTFSSRATARHGPQSPPRTTPLPSFVAPPATSRATRYWETVLETHPPSAPSPMVDIEQEKDSPKTSHVSPSSERSSQQERQQVDRPFPCEQCGARFSRRRNLVEHIQLVHEKRRPFPCDQCNQSFGKKSNLSKHVQLVHEKRKPFTCPHCQKPFGQKSNLNAHVKTVHQQERPFSCQQCNLNFGQKSALVMHERAVHRGEKPHQCVYCEKNFAHKGDLNRHVNYVHSEEKEYRCPHCNASFVRRLELDKHLEKHHSGEKS